MAFPTRTTAVRVPTLIDELLTDIAVRIQLSPTLHALAVARYETIADWIDRPASPLHGRIRRVYAQGSFAIGATIRSKEDDNLFDIDLIAEIDWPSGTTPAQMLDLLYRAIRGEPGSLYYNMTRRQSRCVTIDYAEMHLDVTPMARNYAWEERGGYIAHAKEGTPQSQHRLVAANPWGFAQWFESETPAEPWFSRTILQKSYGRAIKADAEPIPEHELLYAKSMAVVALQLLKRHVYLVYERRPDSVRRPPSVYMSESVARNANTTAVLVDELLHQARALRVALDNAIASNTLIEVRNPALSQDVLTDRWPATQAAQSMFSNDLLRFETALRRAKDETNVVNLQAMLGALFGENATVEVVRKYYERAGIETKSATSNFQPRTTTAVAGLSNATTPRAGTTRVPPHRFYGD